MGSNWRRVRRLLSIRRRLRHPAVSLASIILMRLGARIVHLFQRNAAAKSRLSWIQSAVQNGLRWLKYEYDANANLVHVKRLLDRLKPELLH